MRDRHIELNAPEEVCNDIMNRVLRCQVKGLDAEACKNLGIYKRMSMLLTAIHTLNMVAYRVMGGVDYLIDVMGADAKDIKYANRQMSKAFDAYVKFWSGYYATSQATKEMNDESETLYHQFMKWAQLPEGWRLGNAQQTDSPGDAIVEFRDEDTDRMLRFFKTVVDEEQLSDPTESWMVTKYDPKTKQQHSVEENMDKASAMMVAKRMSAVDDASIYTASVSRTIEERRVEVMPIKCYRRNQTIGSLKKSVGKRSR